MKEKELTVFECHLIPYPAKWYWYFHITMSKLRLRDYAAFLGGHPVNGGAKSNIQSCPV